jgi:outer membrane receptor for ferrienterochelin and colicins
MRVNRLWCVVVWFLLAGVVLTARREAPLAAKPAGAQEPPASIRVIVRHDEAPVPGATVIANGVTAMTGAQGEIAIAVMPGTVIVQVVKEGFATVDTSVAVTPGQTKVLEVELASASFEESVTVAATRTDRRLEDQPLRVEVIDQEEIDEKTIMTPGDIVMMLNETSGMRVQATSPGLGAASVRVQGMRGRYTRFLSDGLPLFGDVGGLGLLQIPPVDLRRVEVIKGVASSLYGAGAMGGVVNLVSRRPGAEPERDLVVNRSTRGATDIVGFLSAPIDEQWGYSLLASVNTQSRRDVNADQWADLPSYSRGLVRPRLFWDNGAGRSMFATAGITLEDREGGSMPGVTLPSLGRPYIEALDTSRFDVGAVVQTLVSSTLISTRAAIAQQRHTHRFGDTLERDRHHTAFAEVTLRKPFGAHTWVAGAAIEHDTYRPKELRQFGHAFTVPGVFVQDDFDLRGWLAVSASARVDHHNRYGTFFSPRVAALLRSGQWHSRLSVGTGFYPPSVLTEDTEAAGISRLVVLEPLRAERGRSASWDLTRSDGPVTSTLTLFYSRVKDPVTVERTTTFTVLNASTPTTNVGLEWVSTLRVPPFSVVANYAFVRSREEEDSARVDAALTPRHSAGVDVMWEREGVGRVGLELYYTGKQRLSDNPYADSGRAYLVIGLLVERQLGWLRVFANGENLTDVRQTKWQPLLRPSPGVDGRVTVDAWAPLEGRNINGGVRLRF